MRLMAAFLMPFLVWPMTGQPLQMDCTAFRLKAMQRVNFFRPTRPKSTLESQRRVAKTGTLF